MASYIPSTQEERLEMLKAVGLRDYRDLYQDVPAEMLLEVGDLNIPEGKSELEVSRIVSGMAAKNRVFPTVLRGAGAYDHYIPSIVKYIPAKEEFLTAYTPYQAEMSQGILQSIFEYQTDICELTGMDVSNASVYDGATAAAEAVAMCRDRKRRVTLISGAAHPDAINTVRTYCYGRMWLHSMSSSLISTACSKIPKPFPKQSTAQAPCLCLAAIPLLWAL